MNELLRFGQLIRSARERKGLQGRDLAERLGVAASSISNIETGRTKYPPSPETLRVFTKVLGLSATEMLEALGYLEPEPPGEVLTLAADDPRAAIVRLLADADDDVVRTLTTTIRNLLPSLHPVRATGGKATA